MPTYQYLSKLAFDAHSRIDVSAPSVVSGEKDSQQLSILCVREPNMHSYMRSPVDLQS
jgi:hypothetical protein